MNICRFFCEDWGEWEYRNLDTCQQYRSCLRCGNASSTSKDRIFHSWKASRCSRCGLDKNNSEHMFEYFKQAPSPALAQDVMALGGENAEKLSYVLDELSKELPTEDVYIFAPRVIKAIESGRVFKATYSITWRNCTECYNSSSDYYHEITVNEYSYISIKFPEDQDWVRVCSREQHSTQKHPECPTHRTLSDSDKCHTLKTGLDNPKQFTFPEKTPDYYLLSCNSSS